VRLARCLFEDCGFKMMVRSHIPKVCPKCGRDSRPLEKNQ
jgi:hypothetical protein